MRANALNVRVGVTGSKNTELIEGSVRGQRERGKRDREKRERA